MASEAQHTPGPWSVDEEHLPGNVYSDDASGSIVATVDGFEYAPRPRAEKLANARLIAAAPDMLAALKAMDAHWAADGFEHPDSEKSKRFDNSKRDVWRSVRAAIAKATTA